MELDVFVCYLPGVKIGVEGKNAEVQPATQADTPCDFALKPWLLVCVCSCTYLPCKGAKSYAGLVRCVTF